MRAPPGDEIYREGDIAFFEVNGSSQETYCENLSYISRMFLDHKNLQISIAVFFFYVLCEVREDGYHLVGYFSKEKVRSQSDNNLSCILVMPFAQRAGYGKMLIEMSYCLSMIEERPGGPEKPLSDLGHKAYAKFWTRRVVDVLLDLDESQEEITLQRIRDSTGMLEVDINYILEHQKILRDGQLNCDPDFLKDIRKAAGSDGRRIEIDRIRWVPYNALVSEEAKE